jgi:predicted RNA-binding protein with PIN domain
VENVRWIVDASNVIGSRPDGWWRDREGATRRLIAALEAFAADSGDPVTVVLDAPADLGDPAVDVVVARRRGRNAADDEIVRKIEAVGDASELRVVTSDRDLADRVRALGANVEGAGRFRDRLGD